MQLSKNKKAIKLIGLLFILQLSHTLHAAHALPEFSARYAVQKYGLKLAEALYQLRYTDSGYKFTQNTELFGVASMFADDSVNAVSYVDSVNGVLLLKKHTFVQTGREKNRDENVTIQWDTTSRLATGKISGIVRSKKVDLETSGAIWEVLSFQIPLMIEADKNKKEYPYKALLKGEIDTYNFVLTSSEKIPFADKQYQALHMVRTDPHKNRQLHIWLAPELHNMPMIIENFRDGKLHSRMQLESLQINNDKAITETLDDDNDDF